ATATILTGLAASLTMLFLIRVLLGVGEGATFPVATRAMQSWTPPGRRGFAQGITHAFARFGNAVTPPIVAWLIALVTWRGSFVTLGCTSLIWVMTWIWYFRDNPAEHTGVTAEELARLPNRGVALQRRRAGVCRIVRLSLADVRDARPDAHHARARLGVFLRGARHRTDVGHSHGHRAEVLRHRERHDEHRIGARRDPFSDCVRRR